jgi:spoIIIJ-associated protein
MRMIETTAKSPEEAIEIALKELDVERQDVEIDVVSKGKAGILGIGGEPAKVRVTVMEKPPDAVVATTDILQSLVSLMDVSAAITLVHAEREDVGGPVFDVDGDDSGLLIGRRGETLRALQFLVSFIASRRLGDRVNLFIDVAGYQERRYETLRSLAQRVARRVASSGREAPLEPMPPNERRIVHMALGDDPDVNTISEGMGDGRRVIIEPTD